MSGLTIDIDTKKQSKLIKVLAIIDIILFISYFCYFLIIRDEPYYLAFLMLLYIFLFFVLSIIIHETGHLFFGLLSGYKFLSFQILFIKLTKENGKLQLQIEKSFLIGQCLLSIPTDKDYDQIKYKAYNYGGSIFNLITFLISLVFIISNLIRAVPMYALAVLAFINLYLVFCNFIPLNQNGISNDALNVVLMNKHIEVRNTIFNLLKLQEMIQSSVSFDEFDEKLMRNDDIEIDFYYVNLFPFHYLYTLYKIYKDMENPFELVLLHQEKISSLPLIYRIQNEELLLFYKITNNLHYKYLLCKKEEEKHFKKPDKDNFLQYLDYYLMQAREKNITKELFMEKMKLIEKDMKKTSLKYEYALYLKLINISKLYLEDLNNAEGTKDEN